MCRLENSLRREKGLTMGGISMHFTIKEDEARWITYDVHRSVKHRSQASWGASCKGSRKEALEK